MPGILVIRADGGTEIGAGHVMRCLALAQEWQTKGGKAVFVNHCDTESLRNRIEAAGIELIRDIPVRARRVLITLGGADRDNVTRRVSRNTLHTPNRATLATTRYTAAS